jgi:hypothetical protein
MSFLDNLNSKIHDISERVTNSLQHNSESDTSGVNNDNNNDSDNTISNNTITDSEQFDPNDAMSEAIKPQRSDILELLNIPDNYEVPDNVLLVGDLDRVRFDLAEPRGYSIKMVDDFYDSVYESLKWYRDTLRQRNRDIAKLATQLDKSATDLHNAKLNAELSDGLTVITGQESTAEHEVQELQLTVVKLRDENERLKRQLATGGTNNSTGNINESDRVEELQNQLTLAQVEIKKLSSQLRRENLANMSSMDDDLDIQQHMEAHNSGDNDIVAELNNGNVSSLETAGQEFTMSPETYHKNVSNISDAQNEDNGLNFDFSVNGLGGSSENNTSINSNGDFYFDNNNTETNTNNTNDNSGSTENSLSLPTLDLNSSDILPMPDNM